MHPAPWILHPACANDEMPPDGNRTHPPLGQRTKVGRPSALPLMDGYGWMDMDGWIWMDGYGWMDMDGWIWMDGYGWMDMD